MSADYLHPWLRIGGLSVSVPYGWLPNSALLHEGSHKQGPRSSRSHRPRSTSFVNVFTPTYCTAQEHVGLIPTMRRPTNFN